MLNALRFRYIKNWEKARQLQQVHKFRVKEKRLKDTIFNGEANISNELRCNLESQNYLENKMRQIKDDCTAWIEKYEHDYDAVEVEIQVATEQLDELRKKSKEMHAVFESRQNRIDTYIREEREKEEFTKNMIKWVANAIKLQVGHIVPF